MMMTHDLLSLALYNLLRHKVRSILTSLGVIFGVGSVIAMLAISEGAKRSALAQIEAMGIDKIIVYSKKPLATSKSQGNDNVSIVELYGLTEVDAANLRRMDNVSGITGAFNARKTILRGLQPTDLKLVGVGRDFLKESASGILQGRWFTPADFANATSVCVIGRNVKRKLYSLGSTDIVGRSLRIDGAVYRIVGIMENPYDGQYPELGKQNDMIVIPMPTSRSHYQNYAFFREGRNYRVVQLDYDMLLVKVVDTMHIDNTAKRIEAYLGKTHAQKDWGMVVPMELLLQREKTQNIFTIVMGSIAAISLVVGGIGIMNIMLASVYERRKEIGTRRALGAQKLDILLQFLIETIVLTSAGGVIGIITGVGIGKLITVYSGMPTIYSLWSIVASLAISSLVGVIFGTYPAYQAAQQNPITVLRAE